MKASLSCATLLSTTYASTAYRDKSYTTDLNTIQKPITNLNWWYIRNSKTDSFQVYCTDLTEGPVLFTEQVCIKFTGLPKDNTLMKLCWYCIWYNIHQRNSPFQRRPPILYHCSFTGLQKKISPWSWLTNLKEGHSTWVNVVFPNLYCYKHWSQAHPPPHFCVLKAALSKQFSLSGFGSGGGGGSFSFSTIFWMLFGVVLNSSADSVALF